MAGVKLQGVSKKFGKVEVLHAIDLAIEDGEFVVFVGPSGCGKSTLLRTIAGLEEVSAGDIWIGDRNVTWAAPAARGVSMVFQSYALYPHMDVYHNISFGLKLAKASKETVAQRVEGAVSMLQIGELLDRYPRQLSGGQRQRVAIARAIVRQPQVLLFDEPLSNLDAALRAQTRVELARMHRRLGTTVIYVTHDQLEAMTLANRIALLNQGRIEQIGTPSQLYHHPRTLFTAQFIGTTAMNLIPVTVAEGEALLASGDRVPLPAATIVTKATLGIRPEDVAFADGTATEDTWSGRVTLVEELGEARVIHTTLGDGTRLVVRNATQPPPKDGDTVRLSIDPQRLHLFDEQGIRIESA